MDECDDVEVVGSSTSLDDFEELIDYHSPDIVFIDSNLTTAKNFECINNIRRDFEIVFITKNVEFSILAFKYSALYCICKPFEQYEFKKAIARFKNKRLNFSFEKLDSIFQETQLDSSRIMLPDVSGFRLININDIIRCEANSCYTNFYLKGEERIIVSKPLSSFIDLLPKKLFCRVHNKHLVNLNYINQYIKGRGGVVILQDGSSVVVSERKKKEFIEQLKSIAYSFSEDNVFSSVK